MKKKMKMECFYLYSRRSLYEMAVIWGYSIEGITISSYESSIDYYSRVFRIFMGHVTFGFQVIVNKIIVVKGSS